MVYVGTKGGHVDGFGITGAAALKSGGTASSPTPRHSATSARHATLTATRTVTVTGASVAAASTPDPFTISQVTRDAGRRRHGDRREVPSHPAQGRRAAGTGEVRAGRGRAAPTGAVVLHHSAGPAGTVSVPLDRQTASSTGLFATSPSIAFVLIDQRRRDLERPVGINVVGDTSIVNGGDTPVRVTSVKAPPARSRSPALPKAGTVIKPGAGDPGSGRVHARRGSATANSSFTITTNTGQTVTVTLTGTGLKPVTKFAAVPAR